MSKMDITIKRITRKLNKISGLDGEATRIIEALEKQVNTIVDYLLLTDDDEKGDKIVFENALSPQKYLELVTGKTYVYDLCNDEEKIAQILKENGKEDYSDYPLSEAYILYEDMNRELQFVLVELLDCETGNKYYRFYQY